MSELRVRCNPSRLFWVPPSTPSPATLSAPPLILMSLYEKRSAGWPCRLSLSGASGLSTTAPGSKSSSIVLSVSVTSAPSVMTKLPPETATMLELRKTTEPPLSFTLLSVELCASKAICEVPMTMVEPLSTVMSASPWSSIEPPVMTSSLESTSWKDPPSIVIVVLPPARNVAASATTSDPPPTLSIGDSRLNSTGVSSAISTNPPVTVNDASC
mmetsp:Transcript_42216/g.99053  ORF Transcript_42216/g.99053 Transcript_42216/m.99053 type:complete len:214 (-) Transcript_42216:2080-2721(-)